MKASRWKKVERIFNKSVLMPPEKRNDFIKSACGGDTDLLEEVLTLIAEADSGGNFLSEPVFEIGAKIMASELVGVLDEPNFASYEMLKILGHGGSGVVFLAKDVVLERKVALKVLPSTLSDDDERILRFQQEAKAASAISHPNVAHIYGFGKASGRYYLAMEYVNGKTLRELLKTNEVDKNSALQISCQIAKALSAAHKAGIIHRDIKPENIIVNEEGFVKVLDFGLAKPFLMEDKNGNQSLSPSLETKPGMIIGTTAYMSPEQIRGKPLDARTDIWSLGVCLYEMLTGTRPFTGETQSDVQARILLADPEYDPEIERSPELKGILEKSLAKNIISRYQETLELVRDLETIQNQWNYKTPNAIHYSFSPTPSPSAEYSAGKLSAQIEKPEYISDKTIVQTNIVENSKYILGGFILLILLIFLIALFYTLIQG